MFATGARGESNFVVRIMAANLPGNSQAYEEPHIRILRGLRPDVVAIQEFNHAGNSTAELRAFVDTAFGTNFSYFREPGYSIPNGVISRWPILAAGSWNDPEAPDRGFAWARIDLPGTNDLYVVSVHFLTSSAAKRAAQATHLKSLIQSSFPANAWLVVAGDLNTDTRAETALATLKTFVSDNPIPTDAESGGSEHTNLSRNKPYDYVLPGFALTNYLTNVVFTSRSFARGLVFDSRVYIPLSDVPPVLLNDSAQGQHMAVLKDFHLPASDSTNPPTAPAITGQPQSLTVVAGANAAFTVTASGTAPLAYQWRFKGTNLVGAAADSFIRTNAQPADAGDYTVVVTNFAGSITSAVATLAVNLSAPGDVIAQWNFNSAAPDGNTTTGTIQPSVGGGAASLVGGVTQTFSGGSMTDPDSANGDNSAWSTTSYPPQGTGNKTAGVRLDVSTAGRQNIGIRWDQRASNTGSKHVRLQYSVNGADFTDYPTAVTVNGTSFESKTNDLSAFPGVNDNPNFAFRIVAEFESTATGTGVAGYVAANSGSTYGTSGTIRYDMVTVSGAPLPVVTPPSITNQPQSLRVWQGADATFQVGAAGTAPLSCQWRFNLVPLPGATSSHYIRSNAQPAHIGGYSVVVSNAAGVAVSSNAALELVVPPPFLSMPVAGVILWPGLSNLPYTVQARANLNQTNWSTLGTAASPGGLVSFTNAVGAESSGFYRVVYP